MPTEFEFNTYLLLFIAEHVHSCKYGTFMFNSYFERIKQKLEQNTISLWMEVEWQKEKFTNPHFNVK